MREGRDPLAFVNHLRRGSKLIEDGELEEAEAELLTAARLRPSYAQTFYYLGKAAMKGEQWKRAIAYYHKALALNPDLVEAHFHLARIYEQTGDAQKAMDEYQEAIALQVPGKSDMAERGLERVARMPEARRARAREAPVSVRFDTPLNAGDCAILSAVAAACLLLVHFGFALLRAHRVMGPGAEFSLSMSPRVVADLAAIAADGLILFFVIQYVLLLLRGDAAWLGWHSKSPGDDLLFGFAVCFTAFAAAGFAAVVYQGVAYAAGGALPSAGRLLSGAMAWEMKRFVLSPPALTTYLVAGLAAPLAEEFFFRGLLYSALRKNFDFLTALLICSAVSGAALFFLIGGVTPFLIAAGAALVFESRMSLFSAVVFHSFCNLLLLGLFQLAV